MIFTAKIDRISSRGREQNGIVESEKVDADHINIGPVTGWSVGRNVKVRLVQKGYGFCFTNHVRAEEYRFHFNRMFEHHISSKEPEVGSIIRTEIESVTDGTPTAKYDQLTIRLDNFEAEIDGISKKGELGEDVFVEIIEHHCNDYVEGNVIKVNEKNTNRSRVKEIPDVGESFEAEIDGINKKGHGIIETKEGQINLGPITQDGIGTEVKAVSMRGNVAFCETESVTVDDYKERFRYWAPIESINWHDLTKGETIETVLLKISSSGNGIIDHTDGGHINIGPVKESAVGSLIKITKNDNRSGFCETNSAITGNYIQDHPADIGMTELTESDDDNEATGVSDEQNDRVISSDRPAQVGLNEKEDRMEQESDLGSEEVTTVKSDVSPVTERETNNSASTDDTAGLTPATLPNIEVTDELKEARQEAEKDATQNPIREEIQTTRSQYVRSDKIKRYGLKRAKGVCEYCGDPAPFKKSNGEPYLVVHHVNELGDGGADDPSLVVALCPNCHSEIHYGRRGSEINQALREKLDAGLGDVGATD